MFHLILRIQFAALILGFGLVAQAQNDILLIDVNNVVPEIDHIRKFMTEENKQGRELGTKLVLVPSEKRIPMENRRQIQELHLKTIDPGRKFYQERCSMSAMAASPSLKSQCETTLESVKAADRKASSLMNGSHSDGSLSIEDIKAEITEALKSGHKFSRVIISGHHSADTTKGFLSGELYAGFTSDIAKELLNNSPATREARSVIMLGCWSGRKDMMETSWGQLIPQARYHSGFVNEAPAKVNPINLTILDSILKNEEEIGQASTESQLRQAYSKIKMADRQVSVLVGDMYITPKGIQKITTLKPADSRGSVNVTTSRGVQ